MKRVPAKCSHEPEQEASVVSEGGPAGSPEGYGPTVQRTVRPSPYDPRAREVGFSFVSEDYDEPNELEQPSDYWEWDPELNVLVRWHGNSRFGLFKPSSGKGCPIPTSLLG